MPPEKDVQQQLDAQTEAIQGALATFQLDLRELLQASFETALRTVMETRPQAPRDRRRTEQVYEEDEEDDFVYENPFAGLQERPILPHHREVLAVPRGDNRNWESGFRLDLPEFSGSIKPDELLDWISPVEEHLTFKQVPDDMRVPLVATRFKGRASSWWQQVKEQRI